MKIKRFISLVTLIATVFAFSGCSLNLFSVESLLVPPLPAGKNGEVQKAFTELMGDTKFQFKSAVSGDYQTAFVLNDMNGDSVEEALVFYSDSSTGESSVRMSLMQFKNNRWKIASDTKGAGNGIFDVKFTDLNGDKLLEIIVSWTLLDSKTQIMSVYQLINKADDEDELELNALGNEYCNTKTVLDFNTDGKDDIVLIYLDDAASTQKSYMRMLTMDKMNRLHKYGETILDSSMTNVSAMVSDSVEINGKKANRIFVECMKNDRMMFTELIYWDNDLSLPVRAFTEPSVSNLRSSSIKCFDIDGDGLLEIPSLTQLYGNEESFTFTRQDETYTLTLVMWNNVYGDKNKEVTKTLFNPLGSYLITFTWGDTVTVKYDQLRDALVFIGWDNKEAKITDELFTVTYRQEKPQSEVVGEFLAHNENGYYYYKITDAGYSFGITDEIVKSSFISLN